MEKFLLELVKDLNQEEMWGLYEEDHVFLSEQEKMVVIPNLDIPF